MDNPPTDKPVVLSAENYANKSIFKFSILNPKIVGALTVVLLLIGGVGTGVYLNQTPKNTVTQATLATSQISFRPSKLDVSTGQEFTIDVYGNANGNQITSTRVAVKYDPEILKLTSISPKEFLPKVLNEPSLASGSASIFLGTDGNSGITGSGILATLSFKAIKQSATRVSFDSNLTKINVLGSTTSPVMPFEDAVINITGANLQIQDSKASESGIPNKTIPSASSSASAPGISKFDFNSDGVVNSVDLSLIYSAWGKPDTELKKKADLNLDGVVNGLDYSLFLPELKR